MNFEMKLNFLAIEFEWVKSARRKKSIALKMSQSGTLQCITPHSCSKTALFQFLQNHESWFIKGAERLSAQPKVRTLARGQLIELLGEPYRLEIVWAKKSGFTLLASSSIAVIQISQRKVNYALSHSSKAGLEGVIQSAIQEALSHYFAQWLQVKLAFWEREMSIRATSFKVKNYRARWGSCDAKGGVQFNWRLVFAPEWVVDYVIVHELAHLFERNHGQRFWRIVETHFPQYQVAKQVLVEKGAIWMEY